jgi:hypothetical protein
MVVVACDAVPVGDVLLAEGGVRFGAGGTRSRGRDTTSRPRRCSPEMVVNSFHLRFEYFFGAT